MDSISKKENTKDSIIRLADEAKTHINKNKYLLEMIGIFKQQISIVKNIITNYSLKFGQNKKIVYNLPFEYKNQLSSLNLKLKEDVNKNLKKKENNINCISQDLIVANQTLSQMSIDNFILKNTITKYNSVIQNLNKSIDLSRKYDNFREPKRESEMELKESKNAFLVYNLECQQKMLSYCREYGSYKYKNIKKASKIDAYKKNISLLKNIINYYFQKVYGDEINIFNNINQKLGSDGKKDKNKNNKNSEDIKTRIGTTPKFNNQFGKNKKYEENNKYISINQYVENDKNSNNKIYKNNSNADNSFNKTSLFFDNDTNLFTDNYKENTNSNDNKNEGNITARKKINILNIDELLDINNIEVEDEEIIEDELNSDDETLFEKKVKQKKRISTDFLPVLKNQVPSINLSQIEFNKLKIINEADAYSLQKRRFEQGNINGKIKNIKNQIKNMKKRILINKKKLDVIHNFIEDVKYNYKLLRPIKVQTSAAGSPVNYIREKLLNIVEETISQTEKKDIKISVDKIKTGKTAVDEGEENDEELIGSDYSDEDQYLENHVQNEYESNNKEKENKNIDNKNKKKNREIKANLISKFESDGKEENNNDLSNNDKTGNIKNNIFESISALSK